MKNFKLIIKPALILAAICLTLTAILALTNNITSPLIAQKNKQTENAALKEVINADDFTEIKNEDNMVSFKAQKQGKTVGYCYKVTVNGYGGEVTAIIGIADKKITSVVMTDVSNETPGLGQNATKTSFTDQFKGKSAELSVVKSGAKENEVQAVTKSVNLALELYKQIEGEVGK